MYTLLWLIALVQMWITLKLTAAGPKPRRIALWVSTASAGLFTHHFYVFLYAAMFPYLMIRPGRFPRRWLAAATIVTGLIAAPWYVQVPQLAGAWRITKGWLNMQPVAWDPISGYAKFA
jgi:hypothetical protein